MSGQEILEPLPSHASDAQKLRWLAMWFDNYDAGHGITGREVQSDLERIAAKLERSKP